MQKFGGSDIPAEYSANAHASIEAGIADEIAAYDDAMTDEEPGPLSAKRADDQSSDAAET